MVKSKRKAEKDYIERKKYSDIILKKVKEGEFLELPWYIEEDNEEIQELDYGYD